VVRALNVNVVLSDERGHFAFVGSNSGFSDDGKFLADPKDENEFHSHGVINSASGCEDGTATQEQSNSRFDRCFLSAGLIF